MSALQKFPAASSVPSRLPSPLEPWHPSEEEGKPDLCAPETHGHTASVQTRALRGNLSCVSWGKLLTLSELLSSDGNNNSFDLLGVLSGIRVIICPAPGIMFGAW